jgi:hypothetical protein
MIIAINIILIVCLIGLGLHDSKFTNEKIKRVGLNYNGFILFMIFILISLTIFIVSLVYLSKISNFTMLLYVFFWCIPIMIFGTDYLFRLNSILYHKKIKMEKHMRIRKTSLTA